MIRIALCDDLLDGFEYDEIASILGIRASYVSTRLNRLKQKISNAICGENLNRFGTITNRMA